MGKGVEERKESKTISYGMNTTYLHLCCHHPGLRHHCLSLDLGNGLFTGASTSLFYNLFSTQQSEGYFYNANQKREKDSSWQEEVRDKE